MYYRTEGFAILFGGAVYSLTCHQYLPALGTPLSLSLSLSLSLYLSLYLSLFLSLSFLPSLTPPPPPPRLSTLFILVAPIEPEGKKSLNFMFYVVYAIIFVIYMALCWTATFAFNNHCLPESEQVKAHGVAACIIQKVYTNTFTYVDSAGLRYTVMLLPLASVATNFPIIAVTLRNCLRIAAGNVFGQGAVEVCPSLPPSLSLSLSVPLTPISSSRR